MPNLIAFAALAMWPVVTAFLFRLLPGGRALIVALLAGYLLLPPAPTAFDLPLVPPLNKDSIPVLASLAMAVALYRPGLQLWPQNRLARVLVVLYVVSPIGTALTNPEPLVWGPVVLPGHALREALGMVIGQAIALLPFLLARHFLARPEDHRDLLVALVVAGLVYSLPILVEVRLSPQINTWVYGYFQHLFSQMIRGGGFRPIVFLYHALWVAFFVMTAVVAAAALARNGTGRTRTLGWAALGWLAVILFLCKSYASMFYAAALVPVVLMLSARAQFRVALFLTTVALAYPIAKSAQLVPEAAIVSLAGQMGEDRAHTLQYRFDNETVLAGHAQEKPVFGWGLWGRHHLYDSDSGQILTVTDGRWILILGVLGLTGFVAEFGLLALPVALAWRRRADAGDRWVAPVVLLLGVNTFDLIPNATITPLTWLMAGAVLGHAERRVRAPGAAGEAVAPATALPRLRTVL